MWLVAMLGMAMTLSACDGKSGRSGGAGGGGGGGGATTELRGLAAVGAPVSGARVEVICDGVDLQTTTNAGGAFTVDVPEGAYPCVVKVSGGDPEVTLYSYAAGAGQVNVTPLTTLAFAVALNNSAGLTDLDAYIELVRVELGAGTGGGDAVCVYSDRITIPGVPGTQALQTCALDVPTASCTGPSNLSQGANQVERSYSFEACPAGATVVGAPIVNPGSVDLAALGAAIANASRNLVDALAAAGYSVPTGVDLFTTSFEPVAGDAYDDLLEALAAALAANGQSLGQLIASYVSGGALPQASGSEEPGDGEPGEPEENFHGIGGSVSGLSGTLVLRNNGGDDLTIVSDGAFHFATPVAVGGAYSVTVFTQPAQQSCTVADGMGTATANVSNVTVTCESGGQGPVDPPEPGPGFNEIANGVAYVRLDKPTSSDAVQGIIALAYIRDADGAGRVLFSRPADISEDKRGVRAYYFAHLNADGSYDTGKGEGGITRVCASCPAEHPLWDWNAAENAYSWNLSVAATLPDGRIIAVLGSRLVQGFEGLGFPLHDRALVRLTRDGELDATFGDQGILPLRIDGSPVRFYSLAGSGIAISQQPDGNGHLLVFVGNRRLMKIDSDGQVVTDFGDNGVLALDAVPGSPHQLVLDPNGDVFVFSSSRVTAIDVSEGAGNTVSDTYTIGSYRLTPHPVAGALLVRKDNPVASTDIRHLAAGGEEVASVRGDFGVLHRDGQLLWLDDDRLLFTSLGSDSAQGPVSRIFAVYDLSLNALDNPYAEGCADRLDPPGENEKCRGRFYGEVGYPLPDDVVRHPHAAGSAWSGFVQEGDDSFFILMEDIGAWVLTRFPKH